MGFNVEMIVQNKLKGISRSFSTKIKFEEHKQCLDAEEYQQECDKYNIRSTKYEMNRQQVLHSTLSLFDDKRCYESNI